MILWIFEGTLTGPGGCCRNVCPASFFVDGEGDVDAVETGDQVIRPPDLGEDL